MSARTSPSTRCEGAGESRRESMSSVSESPGLATHAARRCRIASTGRWSEPSAITAARQRARARFLPSSVRAASVSHSAIRCSSFTAMPRRRSSVSTSVGSADSSVIARWMSPMALSRSPRRSWTIASVRSSWERWAGSVKKRRRARRARAASGHIAVPSYSRTSSSSTRRSTLGVVGSRVRARSRSDTALASSFSRRSAIVAASSSRRALRVPLVSMPASSSSASTSAGMSRCAET